MKLVILIPLALMIISDYKSRTVVLWQLLLFGVIVLITSLVENEVIPTSINLAINISVSLLIGASVYLYFLVRYKSAQMVIGKGDVLFILFLTPLFTPRLFLLFMLVSFIATLLMWFIATPVRRNNAHVPLISGIGLCLFVLLVYQQLMQNL